jgi:hypothetical protein
MVQKITSRPGQEAYLTGPNETLSIPMIGSGVIADGQVVARTTDGKSVQAVVGETPKRFGVVVRNGIGKSGQDANGNEAYKLGDILPVKTIGSIWVKPAAPVTDITSKVYVKTANGTTQAPLGSLSSVEVDGAEFVGASWETVTNAEGLAIIRLLGA